MDGERWGRATLRERPLLPDHEEIARAGVGDRRHAGGSTATLAGATAGEGSLAAEDDALAESKGRVSQQGARSSRGPLSRAAACPSCCVAAAGQQHESFACPIDRQNTMEKPASAKEATKATRKPIDSHRLHPNRARTLRMRASGAGWGRGFVLTVGSLRAVGGDRT